jgi:large subunit ribosomal protein L25
VIKDLPTHVDFMRLRRTSRINLFIPVEFINEEECTGIKRGGSLTVVRPEVELMVTAGDIPEKLTVDLAGLPMGETITISAITLPEGTRPIIDRDFVIANITAPAGISADEEDEEVEVEEVAEE